MEVDMEMDQDLDAQIEQMKLLLAEGVKLLIYNWSTLSMAIDQGLSQENVDVYSEIKKLMAEGALEEAAENKEAIEKYLNVTSGKIGF